MLQFTPAIDQFLFTGTTSGNQILDGDFSLGLNGWQITSATPAAVSTQAVGTGYQLSFASSSAMSATLWQDVTALPSGSYTMTGMVESNGGAGSATMFVWPTGGSQTIVNLPAAGAWTTVQIPNVQITQGTAYLGFAVSGGAGGTVNIQSVQFALNY